MSDHTPATRMATGEGFSDTLNGTSQSQQVNAAGLLEGDPQFRIAIIALAAINMAAALFMIGNILYDAWIVRHWDFETKRQKYFGWLLKIHAAEMFPLIISGSIVLQALVFIPVQCLNAMPILFDGCGRTVQLVFPALWLSFSTMLIFGLETAFRSLRRVRFPSRNKWHIPTAVAVIAAMIFAVWAATNVFPTRGKCLTGLVWWTARYAKLAVVLASGLLALYPTSAAIITTQLVKTVKVEKAERIAATRVVYYLIANTWLIILVLPYYVQILIGTPAMRTAQVAQVALNVSGLLNLMMHVFLRSNADRLAIRAVETPWSDKRTIRVFGPSDLNVQEHINYPLLWNEDGLDRKSLATTSEKATRRSGTDSDYDAYSASGPLQHIVFPSPNPKIHRPLTPPLKIVAVSQIARNYSSYALFPTAESTTAHMSSSTTFENVEDNWDLPLPPAPLFARKHDRSDSAQSSETVQIGLRLSYINHALDPIEASPPSIIGLSMALQTADTVDHEDRSRPALMRTSASSETLNDSRFLPAQRYRSSGTIPNEVFVESEALMPDPAEYMPRPMLQQQQVESVEASVLPQLSFNVGGQAPVPVRAQEPVQVVDLSSQAISAPLQQRPSVRQIKKPPPVFPSRPFNRPNPYIPSQPLHVPKATIDTRVSDDPQLANDLKITSLSRPSGLPHSPKPAPSWRPQNWNTPRNKLNLSPETPKDERKALPGEKALPNVSSAVPPFKSNNPFNTMTPQVIHRPPGWK